MSEVKSKKSHPFLVKKETAEEKSWSDYEQGYDEGFNAGIVDFEAVEREKQKLRDKGIKVIGDKKMYEQTRKQLLDILEAVRANPDIYEYIGLKLRDLNRIKKELEDETCPQFEVV